MDAIKAARELGKAIQEDARYIRLDMASRASEEDSELQGMISRFNVKRAELNREISKKEKDQQALSVLDKEIKTLYGEIMSRENMAEFNEAKRDMDALMASINQILTLSASGEDPDLIDEDHMGGCSGSCSGCSGCN